MEEFLQNMKTLRSQMNDVEDQAAKISVEEQMRVTTIETLQKDLSSAKSETKRLKEDIDQMVNERGKICTQLLFKQRKINDLESDSCTLSQTLALIQQEKVNLAAKLVEKSTYYAKVEEDLITKLQEQQNWVSAYKHGSKVREFQDRDGANIETGKVEAASGKFSAGSHLNMGEMVNPLCISYLAHGINGYGYILEFQDGIEKGLIGSLDAAKAKFDSLTQMKCVLVSESNKVYQSIELVKSRMKDYKPELKGMDKKSLEEEIEAFLSDKAGETEYLQSLQQQIEMLKGISHVVRCDCGMEYKVELGCAQ